MHSLYSTQQVTATVTYNLPEFTTPTDQLPVTNKSTARVWSSGSWYSRSLLKRKFRTGDTFDPLFQALIHGKDGISANERLLITTRLIEASNHLYRQYAAQGIDIASRIWLEAKNDNGSTVPVRYRKSPNGSLVRQPNPDRSRLVQSPIPILILQGLLGLLFICGGVAYTDLWISSKGTRRMLPQNPGNGAALVGLLFGSDMLDVAGADGIGGPEVLDGWLFRLGWWGGKDGKRFGIDIDRLVGERRFRKRSAEQEPTIS